MNSQQALALEYHCRLGVECLHRRFRYVAFPVSIVLTVNSGWE